MSPPSRRATTGSRARAGTGAGADGETVAVVLSGAGARGAFQAGALSVLVPALGRTGVHPRVWLGTSAGGITAALWAAAADRGSDTAVEHVLDAWRRTGDDDVYGSLPLSLSRTGLRYAAGALLGVGPGTRSLLDTTPLRRTARRELATRQLAANVEAGVVAAVGVIATRMPAGPAADVPGAAGGRSVLFLHEQVPGDYAGDRSRALDLVRGPLRTEHVLASAAVPVAFSPVRVGGPRRSGAWYLDGGVRLNAPLQPAVGLGATRVVLVSATATGYPAAPPPSPAGAAPDIADAAAQVLHAALSDRTTADLDALRRTNRLVGQATAAGRPRTLRSGTGRPYRRIPVLEVSPPPGELGRLAAEVLARRTRGLGRLTELDSWLIGRGLRGAGAGAGRRELLSYLLFDPEYFEACIDVGRRAAADALRLGWQD